MKISCAFSYTVGQQGGIGYPPEIAKISGRWHLVEGSQNHGGTVCQQCSRTRGVPYGTRSGGPFEQPRPFGSACYRDLVPRVRQQHIVLRKLPVISWDEYCDLIRAQYGEPEIIA